MKIAIIGETDNSNILKDKLVSHGAFVRQFSSISRAYKCHCSRESNPKPSRLIDLFRVVYPENEIEGFEDFDILVEDLPPLGLGLGASGQRVVGEPQLLEDVRLKNHIELIEDIEKKSLLIVGCDARSINALELYQKAKQIYWVTNSQILPERSQKVIEKFALEFEQLKNQFYRNLEDWQCLEDYEKAKISKPREPQGRFLLFEEHVVSTIHDFSDREQLFVSLEKAPWLQEETYTFGVDFILNANYYKRGHISFESMRLPENICLDKKLHEPGFFSLNPLAWNTSEQLSLLDLIYEKICSYFSPR